MDDAGIQYQKTAVGNADLRRDRFSADKKLSLFKLCDSLSIVGALTIVYSFTFIHTLLGQNASRSGNPLNAYKRVTADMRHNIREEKGYIPETLLVGVAELLLGLFLSFR